MLTYIKYSANFRLFNSAYQKSEFETDFLPCIHVRWICIPRDKWFGMIVICLNDISSWEEIFYYPLYVFSSILCFVIHQSDMIKAGLTYICSLTPRKSGCFWNNQVFRWKFFTRGLWRLGNRSKKTTAVVYFHIILVIKMLKSMTVKHWAHIRVFHIMAL